MNRFNRWSGGLAASLMVVVAASAVAQSQGEWTMAGRTPDLQRYSPLTQINKANVKSLKAAWTFSTGVLNGHEGAPLVIGNVMYVHSAFPNIVAALDLTKAGAPMIWRFVPPQPAEAKPIACCDLVNRGLAYHPSGKLFIELLAGDLLALDAKTGKQLWRVPNADYKTGSTMTNAPIVIKDIVIAGISGGEFGVRGRVTAFDVNTGKELWRGYSTGPDAEVKIVGDANPNYPSMRGKDLGVSTWQGDEWQHGGGTTWGWYSYDPQLNLFYYV
jgi:PQQ-dependent dehydrogenase (methanol/ethanol family)